MRPRLAIKQGGRQMPIGQLVNNVLKPKGAGLGRFLDLFEGSGSDPSLDAAIWTQNTRLGTSDVNTTLPGKAVCRRFSGAVSGRFTAFTLAVAEIVDLNLDCLYTITGVKFGAVDGLNTFSLTFRHNTKDQTDYDGTGLGAGDKGYSLRLFPDGLGAVGQLFRSDNGAYAAVGAAFTCTGLDTATARTVIVTVTTLADRVRVAVNINGSVVATIDDTSVDRLVAAGYAGFSHFSSQALAAGSVEMDGFRID